MWTTPISAPGVTGGDRRPTRLVSPAEAWQPLLRVDDRVQLRLLDLDLERDFYSFLLRALPGVELPARRVIDASTIITLQGRWKYRDCDWVAGPESYTVECTGRSLVLQTLPDCTDDILLLSIGHG